MRFNKRTSRLSFKERFVDTFDTIHLLSMIVPYIAGIIIIIGVMLGIFIL